MGSAIEFRGELIIAIGSTIDIDRGVSIEIVWTIGPGGRLLIMEIAGAIEHDGFQLIGVRGHNTVKCNRKLWKDYWMIFYCPGCDNKYRPGGLAVNHETY